MAVLLAGAPALAAASPTRDAVRLGAVTPAITTSSPSRPDLAAQWSAPALGVQFHGLWRTYDDSSRAAVLDALTGAGAEWVRIDVGWPTLQSTGPHVWDDWYVRLIDRTLAAADQRGLKILLTFWQTPAWANGGAGRTAPPNHASDYGRAFGWVAQRWASTVDAWEVWNEQNAPAYFTGADPAAYTRLLCAAHSAVKKYDRWSPVVFGGLQYNDDVWLDRAYRAGAGRCFDVMATHPYLAPSNSAPSTVDNGKIWSLGHVEAVRAVMTQHGDSTKGIWFTEFGWSTGTSPDGQPWNLGVSPEQQGEYLTRAVELVRATYPYVGTMIWYRDRDGVSGDPHEDGFGLMTADLVPKPALSAFRDVAAITAAAPRSSTTPVRIRRR